MESGVFAFNGIAIRTYSLVEWNGFLLSIGLWSQFIVAWRAFLPMKTPRTNLVAVFQFGLALTWSEAPFHFKYISINWSGCGWPGWRGHSTSNIYLYVENLSLPRASHRYQHLPRRWERRCLYNYYNTNTVWIIHRSRRHGLNKYITTQRIDRLNNLSTKWHTTEI